MSDFINNQDVGLEAATIKRVRNSSLVERPCAEDVRGSSTEPKSRQDYIILGRGALYIRLKVYRKERWRIYKRECRYE